MELVELHGGSHHGYFLPAEGASDKALALFSFPSLAASGQYCELFGKDPNFVAAAHQRSKRVCSATNGHLCAHFFPSARVHWVAHWLDRSGCCRIEVA